MHFSTTTLAALSASAAVASAGNIFRKRDDITWGPVWFVGPTSSGSDIISVTATTYPGKMPSDQAGGLFVWSGLMNGTGDLVQSIIGSYKAGESECSGADADSTWCISSEVYGTDTDGSTRQWVGDLTTLDETVSNGLFFNYTLVDTEKYTWRQTVHDATTGDLMSSYSKDSGPMTEYNTAVECQDCTGTISEQTWINTTIVLSSADPDFAQTLYTTEGATSTDITTPDNGITWTISKITIPAMSSSSSSSSSDSSSSSTADSSSAVVASSAAVSSSAPAESSSAAASSSNQGGYGGGYGGQPGGGFGGW